VNLFLKPRVTQGDKAIPVGRDCPADRQILIERMPHRIFETRVDRNKTKRPQSRPVQLVKARPHATRPVPHQGIDGIRVHRPGQLGAPGTPREGGDTRRGSADDLDTRALQIQKEALELTTVREIIIVIINLKKTGMSLLDIAHPVIDLRGGRMSPEITVVGEPATVTTDDVETTGKRGAKRDH